MLHLDLPVTPRLRGRTLRFSVPPMTSTPKPGVVRCHVVVETVDGAPHLTAEIVMDPCDEQVWIQVHQVYRARSLFVVPPADGQA